ncbi:lipopolysaccharide biosynthesis protein [Rhodopirellula sp. SWK7]|uniref:lipopolysaccharide biosynthesis protein n=1 Tax=Rhodopirellula sp. SWK7 TaxID=595460 RepID=UPI0002BFF031|nr:oligosaccharide flippase family protein [Rhodopirellula sp. SWK7]EMI40912.1 polysaccharide biosynthesis protein [Rhodopirellula sp. SWK7]
MSVKQLNTSAVDLPVTVSVPSASSSETESCTQAVEAVVESPKPAEMKGTQKRLFRESVWVVGGRLLGIATAIGLNVVLVRVLPPADVGVFFVLGSIITFAAIVAMFGMHTALVRFVSERIGVGDARGAAAALKQGTKLAIFAITIGSLLSAGFLYFAGEPLFGLQHLEVIAPLVALSVFGAAAIQLCASLLRSFHDSRFSILLTGQFGGPLCNLLFIGLTIGLSLFVVMSLQQVMLFCAISLCVLTPIAVIVLYRVGKARLREIDSNAQVTEALPMSVLMVACLPLMLAQSLSYITGQADIWIGGAIVNHDELALYGAARRLMLLIGMPMQLVNLTVIASIAELRAQGRLDDLQRILRFAATLAALAAFAVCIPLLLFPAQITSFIFGEYYADGALVLRILCVGQLVFVSAGAAELTLMMSGEHMKALWINVLTSIALLLSGVLLTAEWGIVGLAIACASIISLQCIGFCLYARRSVGVWTILDLRVLTSLPDILRNTVGKLAK